MFQVTLVLWAHSSRKSTLTLLASTAAGECIFFTHENKGKKEALTTLFILSAVEHSLLPIPKKLSTLKLQKNNLSRWRPGKPLRGRPGYSSAFPPVTYTGREKKGFFILASRESPPGTLTAGVIENLINFTEKFYSNKIFLARTRGRVIDGVCQFPAILKTIRKLAEFPF